MLISSEQNDPHQILLNRGFVWFCFKLIYACLNEGDKIRECYSCLKMMIQAPLHVGFFKIFFIRLASLKGFYLYKKQLQSSAVLKQKNNQEVSCD